MGARGRSAGAIVYAVDVPALAELLRGLRPSQLLVVIDLAERVDEATLGDDSAGRERVRARFGLNG